MMNTSKIIYEYIISIYIRKSTRNFIFKNNIYFTHFIKKILHDSTQTFFYKIIYGVLLEQDLYAYQCSYYIIEYIFIQQLHIYTCDIPPD